MVKITTKDVGKRIDALFGKLYSLGILLGVLDEQKIGQQKYIKQGRVLEKNCPLLPNEKDVENTNDPCTAYTYLRTKAICEGASLNEIYSGNADLRNYFLGKRYTDVKKIVCQLLIAG